MNRCRSQFRFISYIRFFFFLFIIIFLVPIRLSHFSFPLPISNFNVEKILAFCRIWTTAPWQNRHRLCWAGWRRWSHLLCFLFNASSLSFSQQKRERRFSFTLVHLAAPLTLLAFLSWTPSSPSLSLSRFYSISFSHCALGRWRKGRRCALGVCVCVSENDDELLFSRLIRFFSHFLCGCRFFYSI